MSGQDDFLFNLIKSLSPSEKRHFTLFASRHTIGTENNSVKMFRKLAALAIYDEKKFLQNNSREAFTKHFAFNKHFLYKLVLKSLHAYHSGKGVEAELREQLHHVDILADKGLITQARGLLQATLKKAGEFGLHNLVLELLQREMLLTREEGYAGKSPGDITRYVKKFEAKAEALIQRVQLEGITARISLQANTGGLVRSKKTFAALQRLKNSPLLKSAPHDFISAWHYHSAQVGIHFLTLNHTEALKQNERLIAAMEQDPAMLAENPRYYILSLNNQMVLLSNFRRYTEMLDTARKIEAVPVRSQVLRNRKFNISNGLLLQMYTKTGNFGEGLRMLHESNRKLASGEVEFLDLQFEIAHYFAAANLHFGAGEFAEANKYLGYIIDRRDLTLRSDILCFSVIMRMIIQYEMHKQDLLEYTVRSTYRFLYKRDRLYKFEGMLLDFIRKESPHLDTPAKFREAFSRLRRKLLELNKDPYEKNAFAYFDILSWLESKVSARPFKEIVRKNAEALYYEANGRS